MSNIVNTIEVKEILNKIKISDSIVVLDRDKNIDFLSKYDYTKEEVINVISNLRSSDYRYKYLNNDINIDAEYLYVFHQKWSVS